MHFSLPGQTSSHLTEKHILGGWGHGKAHSACDPSRKSAVCPTDGLWNVLFRKMAKQVSGLGFLPQSQRTKQRRETPLHSIAAAVLRKDQPRPLPYVRFLICLPRPRKTPPSWNMGSTKCTQEPRGTSTRRTEPTTLSQRSTYSWGESQCMSALESAAMGLKVSTALKLKLEGVVPSSA